MIRILVAVVGIAMLLVSTPACSPPESDKAPLDQYGEAHGHDTAASTHLSIAVISLDQQGVHDIRSYLASQPASTTMFVFYGNGHAATGNNVRVSALLDSLTATQSLLPTHEPASLPYFSTALSSAVASSLRSDAHHVRTVIVGTFPPLEQRSRAELQRVGPIITRTELDALTTMPDHRFVLIGPMTASPLRDMLLRAFTEAQSSVTTISYSQKETQ